MEDSMNLTAAPRISKRDNPELFELITQSMITPKGIKLDSDGQKLVYEIANNIIAAWNTRAGAER